MEEDKNKDEVVENPSEQSAEQTAAAEERQPKAWRVKMRKILRRALWITLTVALLGGGLFVYGRYFFVFGSGVKTGTLNYVVKKGYVFKTYEGSLIMSGFRTAETGTLQSNQFVFSVDDANLADSLMRLGGRKVELRYNEYLGALPWRGYSKFVVDSILSVE